MPQLHEQHLEHTICTPQIYTIRYHLRLATAGFNTDESSDVTVVSDLLPHSSEE